MTILYCARLIFLLVAMAAIIGCETREASHSSTSKAEDLVVELTASNFSSVVLESDKPVLVDFWAPWCGPCVEMAPAVAEVAAEFDGAAVVGKLNVEEARDLAQEYQIANIPAFLIFKNGQAVDRVVGTVPASRLASRLRAAQ